MKRIVRRSLAIIAGLALGWLAAGLVMTSGVSATHAEDTTHAKSDAAVTTPAEGEKSADHAEKPAADSGHDTAAVSHGEKHETTTKAGGEAHDPASHSAALLKPGGDQINWYPYVLLAVGGLFLAAVILGMPALKIRGPLPPDPADSHDAHGHDDHGHGHDAHGHGKDAHGHGKDDHAKPAGGHH